MDYICSLDRFTRMHTNCTLHPIYSPYIGFRLKSDSERILSFAGALLTVKTERVHCCAQEVLAPSKSKTLHLWRTGVAAGWFVTSCCGPAAALGRAGQLASRRSSALLARRQLMAAGRRRRGGRGRERRVSNCPILGEGTWGWGGAGSRGEGAEGWPLFPGA